MKLKRKVVCAWVVLALVVGLVWYNHQYHSYGYPFMTTPSGLSYKSIGRPGNAKKVESGEWIELSLLMKVVPKKIAEDKQNNAKEGAEAKESSAKEGAEAKESSAKEGAEAKESSAKEGAEAKESSAKEGAEAKESSAKEAAKGKKRSLQERILIDQKPLFLRFDQAFESNNKQIAEMIGMMQERQHMVFKCRPQYFFQEKDIAHLDQILDSLDLNKEDEIVVDIKLGKIMTDQAYNEMLAERCATQLAKDKKLITDYLAAHHIEASSTDSALYYIIDQPSNDTPVVKEKMVKVNYTGRLLDGTIFDTSIEEVARANNLYHPQRPYRPLSFQVGIGQVIKGWDEGLLLLKKHEKARFFIPSALAYGPDARGNVIPENAILLFEVEIVDVSDPSESKSNRSESNESKSK